MTTKRAKQLEQLAMSLPKANQEMQQGQRAARDIQLYEQVRQAPQSTGFRAAGQLGAQQAQAAGQEALQAQKAIQTQSQQVGQMGLQEQGRQQRQEGFEQQIQVSENQIKLGNKLNKLDNRLKTQLLDDQLKFQKDQAGQTLLNTRQLADWAVTKAKSKEEYLNYAQQAQQMYQKDIMLHEAAYNKLRQALELGYIKKGQKLDIETKLRLKKAKAAIEKQIRDKKNKAKNKMSMWSAGGKILGGVAAGIYSGGNPLAIKAGMAGGETLGTLGASAFE